MKKVLKKLERYAVRNLTAIDQLAHTLIGGHPDETISARCWRERHTNRFWRFMWRVVDCLFFWQPGHCEAAYWNEMYDKHKPGVYRRGM